MRTLWTVFRLQALMTLRTPDIAHVFVTTPLYTLVFLSIQVHAGRPDLAGYAVLAPALMALWSMALQTAGELVSEERDRGTMEAVVAAPASYPAVVNVRIAAVTLFGALSFAEAWLVAYGVFGLTVRIEHPGLFLAAVLVSAFAMAGTASCVCALFVLAPSARVLQNALSFPFYLLGGVLVPVSHLPDWLRPLSEAVFLSWSARLLRAALDPAAPVRPAGALGAVALLGLAGALAGTLLIGRMLRRVTTTGTLAQT
ncbi:ABC transporter permease [Streptomyces sp. ID05-04B]|uniref:ABC transporter permease n=1 Tax=unclassified Streptomyces TaxID=2593676 RepID=UPI000D1A492E|nr:MULTISPECIES: ABC transporter permease [unclassified Streptomyces]AVV44171.1 ABC transporter permease [Streptomyces sp. P3]MDX5569910.1 ABC transporter permease [Streptomyces sp. ID05-04B]